LEQIELLRYVIQSLDQLGIPHMLVGSFASIAYGEPRFTNDIDFVIDLTPAQIPAFCQMFSDDDFYLSRDSVIEAVKSRFQFNVLHTSSGNKIDFILSRTDAWGQEQLKQRRRVAVLPGVMGYVARPEDVILGKLWYYSEGGSEKHLRDIAGMLKVSGESIDRNEITKWSEQLNLTDVWQSVLTRVSTKA
jgi:hypothetical protein